MFKRWIRKLIRKELNEIIREDAEKKLAYIAEVNKFVDGACPPLTDSKSAEPIPRLRHRPDQKTDV
ncbi:hypothetical protein D3C74_475520 [compost metagenome]